MNRSDDLFPQPGGTPDPHWQRAFEGAADTPPPRVWEGVERQLDLDEADGILPLWQHKQGRQSMLFGRWAAGIAASLALTLLGWWAWHREDAIRPDRPMAATSASQSTLPAPVAGESVAVASGTSLLRSRPVPTVARPAQVRRRVNSSRLSDVPVLLQPSADEAVAYQGKQVAEGQHVMLSELAVPAPAASQPTDPQRNGVTLQQRITYSETTVTLSANVPADLMRSAKPASANEPSARLHSVRQQTMLIQSFAQQPTADAKASTVFKNQAVPPADVRPDALAAVPSAPRSDMTNVPAGSTDRLTLSLNPLKPTPLVNRPIGNERIVWYQQQEAAAEPEKVTAKKQRQRAWVSAGVTASAFNPELGLRGLSYSAVPNSFNNTANAMSVYSVPTLQNQVGRAVAVQASVGVPLGEHWSVETGVGFLNGQSDVQSPTRTAALSAGRNTTNNLYVDIVGGSTAQSAMNDAVSPGYAASQQANKLSNQAVNYDLTRPQLVSNGYQFVQVPVQVGYEFRPRRKFGLALLTGMVSNWFVRNTVAETVTVRPGDGLYRPVTMAGTAGMRLRFRPDRYWSASVAGTFQQSLQSITRSDASLQALPQQTGLSFSVDRHF